MKGLTSYSSMDHVPHLLSNSNDWLAKDKTKMGPADIGGTKCISELNIEELHTYVRKLSDGIKEIIRTRDKFAHFRYLS